MIDREAIWNAEVTRMPFSFFVAHNVLSAPDMEALREDFPQIEQPGAFPLQELEYGPAFRRLIADLRCRDLVYVLGKKFRINLTLKPLLITVRGHSRWTDGQIHTDSRHRLVSCALYLNDEWDKHPGRVRMVRNGHSFSRSLAEISPNGGTLVVVRRSDHSWHGHLPYEGPRRCVVFNWMTSPVAKEWDRTRHRLSARFKRQVRPLGNITV